jgi:hypothetical protein
VCDLRRRSCWTPLALLGKIFLERLQVRHSYKLPLFGHGPGDI